ncbi:MAG TPA: nucleotidyltransferase family protein [Thermoanaerobaculia bacterium]|nr:nucleotidyltransferase family protein [Thermoanaerobaculia bacterium]
MPAERDADEAAAGPVAGILLAAGTSSRMGSNKLLFDVGGESLLRRTARQALAGGLDPLLVVLGHQAERAAQELAGLTCLTVVNADYEQGITSSLQRGVAALPHGVRAAMVLLADMPFVSAPMIAEIVVRYRTSRAPLVISDYQGVNAPPMLYDRALFGELLTMSGGGCGRQVVKRHRGEAQVLSWPAAALADLDVPEDYARMKADGPDDPQG